ncbi:ATP-dependent RNA helicase SUV3 [Plectosphaerella cucumerina]|uniref:ATP-dependent RNA helicase SUV3, mitochondrial n=1 Tax=Plectosphaerella cucumerina TaxID=40658 RepID=A0A8K0TB49_9PEZI|nr:ATP-dependent RNA helicase SUV3 [Plectosphaerella cucumerina]
MISILRSVALCAARTQPILRRSFATTGRRAFQDSETLQKSPKPQMSAEKQQKNKYAIFKSMVNAQFNKIVDDMGEWSTASQLVRSYGVHTERGLNDEIALFRKAISQAMVMASSGRLARSENPLFWTLRNAFIRGDVKGLTAEIQYSFQSFMMRSRMSPALTKKQKELADFRYPMEWFPATRSLQRTIHLHVGPTNSGKTYHALKALEGAKSGIYGGPLRLLAQEIYARFTAKGLPCAMITGEEQRLPDDADNYFISCTVEMTPLNRVVDVAVIDEIQMIGDPDRGWAWTQALLGVMAKEVHLCGEERSVELVKSICSAIGDKCIVHRYKRLSPLKTSESLNGNLKSLQRGDAIVAFSRVNLHGLKREIERTTGKRCAIVYGSLPPETRAQQAALFNDPNNDYDFLVASDAIGMGLNLEIKRVIFETAFKFDGVNFRGLTSSEIKQIGGRAGRFRTARQDAEDEKSGSSEPKLGLVTTLDSNDLQSVEEAFDAGVEALTTAYINPPAFIMERFAEYLPPDTPLAFLLLRIRELAQISPMFLMDISEDALRIADIIQRFPLTIHERLALLHAPASLHEPGAEKLVEAIGRCLAERKGGALCDIKEINLEILDATAENFGGNGREYLRRVESLHHAISLYLWMSYRFPNIFVSQTLAFHVKELAQTAIENYLDTNVEFYADRHQKLRNQRREEVEKRLQEQQRVLEEKRPQAQRIQREEGPGRWNEPGHEEPLVEEPGEYEQLDQHLDDSPTSSADASAGEATSSETSPSEGLPIEGSPKAPSADKAVNSDSQ